MSKLNKVNKKLLAIPALALLAASLWAPSAMAMTVRAGDSIFARSQSVNFFSDDCQLSGHLMPSESGDDHNRSAMITSMSCNGQSMLQGGRTFIMELGLLPIRRGAAFRVNH
jgi:hypothetical protein